MNIFFQYTKRSLIKNRHRSLVTIISIMLAVIMLTVILEVFVSVQKFLVNSAVNQYGNWNGVVYAIDDEKLSELESDSAIEKVTTVQSLGYTKLDEVKNAIMPYIYIGAVEKTTNTLPVNVVEGRLPETSSEIILPEHLSSLANYEIGDTTDFSIGLRLNRDKNLWQKNLYSKSETFKEIETRKYTVVGIYKKPSFEPFTASGYTALTIEDGTGNQNYDAYLNMVHPSKTGDYFEGNIRDNYKLDYNDTYLELIGCSPSRVIRLATVGIIAGVLVVISVFSALMIYNSFAISVRERTRHFGMLKSIGATKRQIMHTVLYEGFLLSIIAIPLGLLIGMGIFSSVLAYANGLINTIIKADSNTVIEPYFSIKALGFVIILSIITIFISTIIPANKVKRLSPIEAIRQSKDYKMKKATSKTVKDRKHIFGISGIIVAKNFKRSKKKYLSAIFSILLSVVLCITGNSIASYLSIYAQSNNSLFDGDLCYYSYDEYNGSDEELFQQLLKCDNITSGYYYTQNLSYMELPKELLSDEYIKEQKKEHIENDFDITNLKEDYRLIDLYLVFMNDDGFKNFAENLGIDPSLYLDSKNPLAIVNDRTRTGLSNGETYIYNTTDAKVFTAPIILPKDKEGYISRGSAASDNSLLSFAYELDNNDEFKEELDIPAEESGFRYNLNVGYVTHGKISGVVAVLPLSVMETVLENEVSLGSSTFVFSTDDHNKSFKSMGSMLAQLGLPNSSLVDQMAEAETMRLSASLIKLVVNIFMILLALMAAANIFNTVSNDFMLRQREFAIFQSVGLSKKDIYKMTILECLLYSFTGLVIGIPLSIGATYLVYKMALSDMVLTFDFSIPSCIIVSIIVILILFSSMAYSMFKIRKDNTIDVLRNENL